MKTVVVWNTPVVNSSTNIKDNNLLIIKGLNFKKQLNKFDIVICHGGSGVVQQCLIKQIPILIIAHMCDQFYWGNYITKLQYGQCVNATS